MCYFIMSNIATTSHMWLLSPLQVAGAREEPDFKFHLLLINLNLKLSSHMWLVATILDSTAVYLTYKFCPGDESFNF